MVSKKSFDLLVASAVEIFEIHSSRDKLSRSRLLRCGVVGDAQLYARRSIWLLAISSMDEVARVDCDKPRCVSACDVSRNYVVQPCSERDGHSRRRQARSRLGNCFAQLSRLACGFSNDCLVRTQRNIRYVT